MITAAIAPLFRVLGYIGGVRAELVKAPDGKSVPLDRERTLIGRNPDNDVVLKEPFVSRKHCAINRNGDDFILEDLGSSNGTFVNGERIGASIRLRNNDAITFGKDSPSFRFIFTPGPIGSVLGAVKGAFKSVLGVFRRGERTVPQEPAGDPMAESDPDMEAPAVQSCEVTRRRITLPTLLAVAGAGLALVVFLAWVFIFRSSPSPDSSVLEQGLRRLESIHGDGIFPDDPEFRAAVQRWMDRIRSDQAFQDAAQGRLEYQDMIDGILISNSLPVDYSLIVWAESQYNPKAHNYRTGAAGLWQLVPRTARAYGLQVDRKADQRLDPERSTQAAALYLKDLVSMFGKDSFLLVLAAYNAGDGAVLYGLKQIQDPVRDRNFWYLSTHNLIPAETREYVLKVVALAIISQDA